MDNGAGSCRRFFDGDDNVSVGIINGYKKDEGRFLL